MHGEGLTLLSVHLYLINSTDFKLPPNPLWIRPCGLCLLVSITAVIMCRRHAAEFIQSIDRHRSRKIKKRSMFFLAFFCRARSQRFVICVFSCMTIVYTANTNAVKLNLIREHKSSACCHRMLPLKVKGQGQICPFV